MIIHLPRNEGSPICPTHIFHPPRAESKATVDSTNVCSPLSMRTRVSSRFNCETPYTSVLISVEQGIIYIQIFVVRAVSNQRVEKEVRGPRRPSEFLSSDRRAATFGSCRSSFFFRGSSPTRPRRDSLAGHVTVLLLLLLLLFGLLHLALHSRLPFRSRPRLPAGTRTKILTLRWWLHA